MSTIYNYIQLQTFCEAIFTKMGYNTTAAQLATKVLLSADIRGIDSHGIARLSGYVRLWQAGRIVTTTEPHIIHETPSTATIDGGSGLGLLVAPYAMQIAIDKAKNVGSGWVSVQHSNHFGIAGYHAMMALENDMIGIAMTNASALVAPTFSKQKMLGTNPIAVAVPAGVQPAFVADFSTTTAANGKLEILQRKNEATPTGWVQDEHGSEITDANILKKGGALLPLGGDREHSSHKGFCLGSIVDILSGVLSGANYSQWVPPFPAYIPMPNNMPGKGLGHFFGAMRIDAFRPANEFKTDMDNWITSMQNATAINENQKVIIPGSPEREMETYRLKNGIPILQLVVDDLVKLGDELSVEFC